LTVTRFGHLFNDIIGSVLKRAFGGKTHVLANGINANERAEPGSGREPGPCGSARSSPTVRRRPSARLTVEQSTRPADFVMSRDMLRGVKARAEGRSPVDH
jgi:hypothetical protein